MSNVTCQDMLNAFFLPEDQDAFARSQGWQDAEQMCFYENMSKEVPPMTDSEVDDMVARNQSADSEVLHLAHVSCEEAYTDDEACPLALWYDTSAELEGVY